MLQVQPVLHPQLQQLARQGLTGTPDINVRNVTGVAATFTGVLTYEDVTNVDSTGIVTAKSGINVVGGGNSHWSINIL